MDITPTPKEVLHRIRKQNWRWFRCVEKMLDNAFDAGATTIHMTVGKNSLKIEDNGHGCADLVKMVTIDYMGVQYAFVTLGDKVDIVSIHDGTRRHICVPWGSLESWEVSSLTEEPTTALPGTIITVSRLLKTAPRLQVIVDKLGLTYMPALKSGKAILVQNGRKKTELRA